MYIFGDGFDLYATPTDTMATYWDGGALAGMAFAAGRFAGGRALQFITNAELLYKNSGANDAVHHVICAFQQTSALTGTGAGIGLTFCDGATAQCSIVFRQDGAILLTSGGPAGTTLATWTGAVTSASWLAFEFEVVINNTTGSFTARRNGNTANDFAVGSLNTRGGTANNYANRLLIQPGSSAPTANLDDLLWRSDPSAVPWLGDIRCYTRMPGADVSAQFTRNTSSVSYTTGSLFGSLSMSQNSYYQPFTALYDGALTAVQFNLGAGFTGNVKASLFAGTAAGNPTTLISSATPLANPLAGTNTITFPSPPVLSKGTNYWLGLCSDNAAMSSPANLYMGNASSGGRQATIAYATFPISNPSVTANYPPWVTYLQAIGNNFTLVNEPQQDGATSYVYDSNPGDADFYSIPPLAAPPGSVVAVTTRGFVEKSDAGTRGGAVQLKSGSTTVISLTAGLATGWNWLWRTDMVDPNTGAAWTPAAVDNVQIGPVVIN
jgi:hypothetical protein